MQLLRCSWLTIVIIGTLAARSGADEFTPTGPFAARDTLSIGQEENADSRVCLDGLCWEPQEFEVRCENAREDRGDRLVRFPSPVPSGIASNDVVALEWYVARNEQRQPVLAPAVVVVHESGSSMTVGRMFARSLRSKGVHTFLLHLPFYGERRQASRRPDGSRMLTVIRQAIGDVRRARDAVAVLPFVDGHCIALQGTSLGGIISATTAGLDHGYDRVFLMLAGGDLQGVLQNGQRDAARFREELERSGVTVDQLRALTQAVEPTRLAHRVDPKRVWLYTAKYDQVIPPQNSQVLAEAMRLEKSHRVELAADHYTGVIFLPYVIQHIMQAIQQAP